ncbi:CPK3 [Symbiodinium sp. CCMP2592]|nr:CPK3 [Symbiodinium sp. CCMP2592]
MAPLVFNPSISVLSLELPVSQAAVAKLAEGVDVLRSVHSCATLKPQYPLQSLPQKQLELENQASRRTRKDRLTSFPWVPAGPPPEIDLGEKNTKAEREQVRAEHDQEKEEQAAKLAQADELIDKVAGLTREIEELRKQLLQAQRPRWHFDTLCGSRSYRLDACEPFGLLGARAAFAMADGHVVLPADACEPMSGEAQIGDGSAGCSCCPAQVGADVLVAAQSARKEKREGAFPRSCKK